MEPKMNFYYPGEGSGEHVVVPGGENIHPVWPTNPSGPSLPEPKTRKEYYLAAIAGEDVTIPEPKTRQEHYLKEIAENGGGGGGGGIFPVTTTITVTVIPGEMERYSFSASDANHTVAEIEAAIATQKMPVLFGKFVLGEEERSFMYYFQSSENGRSRFVPVSDIKKESFTPFSSTYVEIHDGNKTNYVERP